MQPPRTYLDHNATSPLRPQARAAMLAALDVAGNASSVHAEGRRARALIETAREQVAALAGAKPAEVVFTSGGTEANATILAAPWGRVIVQATEHESVLAPARALHADVVVLPVDRHGAPDLLALTAKLAEPAPGGGPVLVCIHAANNETGIISPIADAAPVASVAPIVRAAGAHLHVDAVQAAGRIALAGIARAADSIALSAHKLGGPKGCGALVLRDGREVPPLIRGGGQEMRRRAGTENVAGITAFGAAARAAHAGLADASRLAGLRDHLEAGIRHATPGLVIIGKSAPRLPNTTCIAWDKVAAETLVMALDLAGVAVSAGAACSSGKVSASHVLSAMGRGPLASHGVRFSLGWNTTVADIDTAIAAWRLVSARILSRHRKVA